MHVANGMEEGILESNERLDELLASMQPRPEEGSDYSAPTAGPPPWDLWAMTPTTAIGVGVDPGATRWRFA